MDSNKLIAPIVITVLMVAILTIYVFIWGIMPIPVLVKIGGLCVLLGLIGVSVYKLCERIEEIRSGEEDDLSKY